MAQIDERVLQAYARLEQDTDFAVVIDDLKSRRDAARDAADVATELVIIGRHQGCALILTEVLKLAQGGASEALEKHRARRESDARRTPAV